MLIDEPPIATFCSGCAKPLVWIFSGRTLKWVAVIPDATDPAAMRVHGCRDGIPQITWRDERPAASSDSPARTEALAIAAAAAGRHSDSSADPSASDVIRSRPVLTLMKTGDET